MFHSRHVLSLTSLRPEEESYAVEVMGGWAPTQPLPTHLTLTYFHHCFSPLPLFHPFPSISCPSAFKHPMTGRSGLMDRRLIRRDMFSLLKSTYYQLFTGTARPFPRPCRSWGLRAFSPAHKQSHKHIQTCEQASTWETFLFIFLTRQYPPVLLLV